MHNKNAVCMWNEKLPFAGYSVGSLKLSGTIGFERYAPLVYGAARNRTPGTKYAGGHRIRVTPVPIPNTEVKPDTADGTAWETVWESRSLPALFLRPASFGSRAFVCTPACDRDIQFPMRCMGRCSGAAAQARRRCGRVGRCRDYSSGPRASARGL